LPTYPAHKKEQVIEYYKAYYKPINFTYNWDFSEAAHSHSHAVPSGATNEKIHFGHSDSIH